MAVLVVGCGSIGSLYASALTRVTEVWALDASQAHVDAINKKGLRISGAEEMTAPVKATSKADELAGTNFDFIIISTKGVYTRDAARSFAPHIQGAPVICCQNGLGNEQIVCEEVEAPVLRGVVAMSGEVIEPGHIQKNNIGPTYIGPYRSLTEQSEPRATIEQAERIGAAMTDAGLDARVSDDVRPAVWTKLIMNSCLGPIRILTGMHQLQLADCKPAYELLLSMVAEGKAVAEKLGYTLEFDPLFAVNRDKERGKVTHRGSLTHDFVAGRKTEIDFLTGAMVATGEKLGVPMPIATTVYKLFKGREAARDQQRTSE